MNAPLILGVKFRQFELAQYGAAVQGDHVTVFRDLAVKVDLVAVGFLKAQNVRVVFLEM